MDNSWLILSLLFGVIGLAVFTYGRRQRRGAPTLVGLALMVYPYFVSDTLALISIGALLLGALFVGQRLEERL